MQKRGADINFYLIHKLLATRSPMRIRSTDLPFGQILLGTEHLRVCRNLAKIYS
jgi:hypothetical protein